MRSGGSHAKYVTVPAPLTASLQAVVDSFHALPPNVLLGGAQGSGRGAVAVGIAAKFHLKVLELSTRSIEDVRSTAALLGSRRSKSLLVIRLDGAHERAGDVLLKALEENTVNHVVVIAERAKPTIVSRCWSLTVPPLPPQEVAQVLITVHGVSEARAEAACSLSTIPLQAIALLDALEAGRSNAMAVLRAADEGDAGLLSAASYNADLFTLVALGVFCKEAISRRWSVFSAEDCTSATCVARERLMRALEVCATRRESPRSSTYVVGKLLSAKGSVR